VGRPKMQDVIENWIAYLVTVNTFILVITLRVTGNFHSKDIVIHLENII
jgi:hypothetical protein